MLPHKRNIYNQLIAIAEKNGFTPSSVNNQFIIYCHLMNKVQIWFGDSKALVYKDSTSNLMFNCGYDSNNDIVEFQENISELI